MGKVTAFLLVIVAGGIACLLAAALARADDDFQKLTGAERMAKARKARAQTIRGKFKEAGLAYPPREIFLRILKREGVVEVWARGGRGPHRLVTSYEVLAASGRPGPKRLQGDRQVPEGFYEIDRYNPESLFHLSLGLNYPNAADRILSDPERPGGDIFIHGKNVTVGCAPIGDASIEELFLIALDTHQRGQQRVPVHVFPARMSGPEWDAFAAEHIARDPTLADFWAQLRAGYDAFERKRLVPAVTVSNDGAYHIAPGR